MSTPDPPNDLSAFIKLIYGDGILREIAAHHRPMFEFLTRPRPGVDRGKYEDEIFMGFDPASPQGDHAAYVRYRYVGHRIIIEDIHTEHMDATETEDKRDTPRMWAGRRPCIADLVARIGRKRCTCDGGLEQVGNFETGKSSTQVCTRCDGFSTQRHRGFRFRR